MQAGKPITMQEILSTLEEHGIRAERKSIYDDMETLREFGMEIQYTEEAVRAVIIWNSLQF